jgi:eukaryotic-like serine/threonine-protein kinase
MANPPLQVIATGARSQFKQTLTPKKMNPELVINILDNLVYKKTGEHLESLQRAIIQGSLNGLTYQEIMTNYPIARNYSKGFLENVACDLWQLLTEVLQDAAIIGSEERVRKKNLCELAIALIPPSDSPGSGGNQPPVSPDMSDRKLRMRYRITEHLVSTEFSDIYLAEDEDLPDRPLCVVECLKSQSIETMQRFELKAEILCKLGKHDRIPELLACFQEDGYFYSIVQFIEGQALSQELLAGEPWKEERVTALLQDILEILAFVHQHDIVHCNIHPDNLILRANDGKIILTDFSAVKEINLSENGRSQMRSQYGNNKEYMPPEQAIGSPKLSSDLYAVGLLGIHALTGLSPQKLLENPESSEFIWCEKARVSSQFACFLDKMVRYYFPQRYPSAIEALQALQNLS